MVGCFGSETCYHIDGRYVGWEDYRSRLHEIATEHASRDALVDKESPKEKGCAGAPLALPRQSNDLRRHGRF